MEGFYKKESRQSRQMTGLASVCMVTFEKTLWQTEKNDAARRLACHMKSIDFMQHVFSAVLC